MHPRSPDPPWGRGPPPDPSSPPDPLDICLSLTRHLFDLGVRGALGALRAALGALGLRGRGGAGLAWLQGLAAFAAVAAGLRELLGHLLPLAALYAGLQALVLLASLRETPTETPRVGPEGREPTLEGEEGEEWWDPPQERWEPPK